MKIGYARVSTREQAASLATQREALTAAGCKRVFADTISGARSTLPGLDAARSHLRDGDSLVVTRLDRLGRSMRDTVNTAAELADEGVRLVLLDMGLDTATREGRLMVGILSALAQQELETIQERTRVGLEHARAQGRVGGRPPKLNPAQRAAALAALRGGLSVSDVAALHGVSRWTITRIRDAAADDTSAATRIP
ncbi:recombinase family protein [Kocuria marina]|uniref:recombinase family protein n=1 Tax=Kocuria marina TaxID=223184 RepID=UPI0011A79C98|nr:recombinase family protein [Kocuria indica]